MFPYFRLCCNSVATVSPVTATAIWVLPLRLEGQRKGVREAGGLLGEQKASVQLVCVAMLRESKHQRKHKGLLSHSQMEK